MTQGMSARDTVDGLGAAPSVTHECVTRATRVSWESSARLPQSALKKSAIRRSARLISRSTSVADKLLNVADCSDRSVSKRSRSASNSSRRFRSSAPAKTSPRSCRRCTSSSDQVRSARSESKTSTPSMAPRTLSGSARDDRMPKAWKLFRSVAASWGSSSILENRTTSPRWTRSAAQGNSTGLENRGHSVDALHRPGDANDGPGGNILDEAGPIHPQELHDSLQPAFDLRVHIAQRDGNQARGELGHQALEAQSLGEQALHARPAHPLEHETGDDQRLQKDQESHREPSGASPPGCLAASRGGRSGLRPLRRICRLDPRPAADLDSETAGSSAEEREQEPGERGSGNPQRAQEPFEARRHPITTSRFIAHGPRSHKHGARAPDRPRSTTHPGTSADTVAARRTPWQAGRRSA